MLTFRDMTLDDRDTVLPMVDAFYRSNAVDHPVPREIVERSFLAAAGNEPLLRGTLIFEEGRLAGYLYVTLCYSAEVGGTCVFIEEVYLLPEFRGRGLGQMCIRDSLGPIRGGDDGAAGPKSPDPRSKPDPAGRGV